MSNSLSDVDVRDIIAGALEGPLDNIPFGTPYVVQTCIRPSESLETMNKYYVDVYPMAVTAQRQDRGVWAERFVIRVAVRYRLRERKESDRDNAIREFSKFAMSVQRKLYSFRDHRVTLVGFESDRLLYNTAAEQDESQLITVLDVLVDTAYEID